MIGALLSLFGGILLVFGALLLISGGTILIGGKDLSGVRLSTFGGILLTAGSACDCLYVRDQPMPKTNQALDISDVPPQGL